MGHDRAASCRRLKQAVPVLGLSVTIAAQARHWAWHSPGTNRFGPDCSWAVLFQTKPVPARRAGPFWPTIFAVFYFFIFIFLFFTKNIFSIWKFTGIYPGSRDLAARQRGGRGFCAKSFAQIIAHRSLGASRPATGRPTPWPPGSWAAGPGRPAAGRPALPLLYKGWLVPRPSFTSLKFQKPRNKREGGREAKPCR